MSYHNYFLKRLKARTSEMKNAERMQERAKGIRTRAAALAWWHRGTREMNEAAAVRRNARALQSRE